jgi:ribosomal protein L37E
MSTCKKCGREKAKFDSSPCARCVLENVAEARKIAAKARERLNLESRLRAEGR